MSCKDCRNLIDICECGDINKISCEAHSLYKTEPKTCKGFLDGVCDDEKKIKKNVRIVTEMYMEDQEKFLG